MAYNHLLHHRRSIRLHGYDYAQAGLYFITLCVQDKAYLFGEISDSAMILNEAGKMVEQQWLTLPQRFPTVALHPYVIMPNHFHGIIENVGATLVVAQNAKDAVTTLEQANDGNLGQGQPQGIAPTISSIISAFKSITTVEYIRGVKAKSWIAFNNRLWQRNYWEHIIRDEKEYASICEYIQDNPLNWETDKLK
ncbi:transposase [Rufibacter sp. H-1]|uniref:Transposase n=2 Tax=Rufibacter sediminis TaxID=2762756 RepID=A0ABR6VS13_9BACT|nr:transposase [Rufibacter sediminis]